MESQENSRSEKFKNAIQDITDAKLSIGETAKQWGVAKSKLYERMQGRVEIDRRSGPPSILTKAE
jgi:hypothetical protein